MFVLVFIDEINFSFGPQSITDHVEIVAIGNQALDLMYHERCEGLEWEHNEDFDQYYALVEYEGEVEEGQRFQIIEVN